MHRIKNNHRVCHATSGNTDHAYNMFCEAETHPYVHVMRWLAPKWRHALRLHANGQVGIMRPKNNKRDAWRSTSLQLVVNCLRASDKPTLLGQHIRICAGSLATATIVGVSAILHISMLRRELARERPYHNSRETITLHHLYEVYCRMLSYYIFWIRFEQHVYMKDDRLYNVDDNPLTTPDGVGSIKCNKPKRTLHIQTHKLTYHEACKTMPSQ